MGLQQLTDARQCQITRMREAGNVCHLDKLLVKSVITIQPSVKLLGNINLLTKEVKDRHNWKPLCNISTRRLDNALGRLLRQIPFTNSIVHKRECWVGVPYMLPTQLFKIEWMELVTVQEGLYKNICLCRQEVTSMPWCPAHHCRNLACWRKVHWSDESHFLVHLMYGRVHVTLNEISKGSFYFCQCQKILKVFRQILETFWRLHLLEWKLRVSQ
jgi:hypothetical protein